MTAPLEPFVMQVVRINSWAVTLEATPQQFEQAVDGDLIIAIKGTGAPQWGSLNVGDKIRFNAEKME